MFCTTYTKRLSIKLQGRWQDIVRAVDNINSVKETIKDARENVDEFDSTWFEKAHLLASKVNVEYSHPRLTSRQTQRSNPPASSAIEYFKRVLTILLLDHLIPKLDSRFNEHSDKALKVCSSSTFDF